jgi:hypothetical protein
MNEQDRNPLSGLRARGAPRHLKRSVLNAAGETLRVKNDGESAPDAWDRLWESRPLRAAWAATTLGLLVTHVALSVTPEPRRSAASVASREQIDELRELLALPTIEISPRAQRMAMGASAPEPTPEHSNDSNNDEVKS